MDPAQLRPLAIGEILDVAIKVYRSHFGTLVKAVAIVVVPVQVLTAVVQASAPGPFFGPPSLEPPEPGTVPEFDAGEIWAGFAAILVVAALGVVAAQLATGASLKAVGDAYLGGQPRWSASLRFAASRLRYLL